VARRGLRVLTCVVASGLATVALMVAGMGNAFAGTYASCNAQGQYAVCTAGGQANDPLTLSVTVTSSPDQAVYVAWGDTCAQGDGAGGDSGSFTAQTPVTRTIPHPYHQPDYCIVAATAQLQAGGNSINVSLSYSKTAPVFPEIKGYDGKCVDDAGNSSAHGAKVQLWNCNKESAQRWAFSDGQLTHNGLCLTATGGNAKRVVLNACNRATSDLWTHKSNGEYVLKAHSGKLCLDDPRSSTANGTALIVYTCNDNANQRWSLP
jgi:hypothetical protein